MPSPPWRLLFANSPPAIRLRLCLNNGQVFGWTHQPGEGDLGIVWTGVLQSQLVRLAQDDCLGSAGPVYVQAPPALDGELGRFFRMDVDASRLFRLWSQACPRFEKISAPLFGLRLLRQDPVECLFSFIASTNNNIPRITSMLAALRAECGETVAEGHRAFPSLDALAELQEQDLRRLGFGTCACARACRGLRCGASAPTQRGGRRCREPTGYRAPFVCSTAAQLKQAGGAPYLRTLMGSPALARAELMKFSGVGPKVADCVALFSLDCADIVPVDTHVLHVAKRDYDSSGALEGVQALTKQSYALVAGAFVSRFGECAGWAHSVLFTAELAAFRDCVPQEVFEDMQRFRDVEKARKRELKLGATAASLSGKKQKAGGL
jgi:N-glycosylase/DNA lyase